MGADRILSRADRRRRDNSLAGTMTGVAGLIAVLAFIGLVFGAVVLIGSVRSARRRGRQEGGMPKVRIGMLVEADRGAVELGLDELQQGILVGGSPGAGKTTLLAGMSARLPDGIGLLYVDLKGDRSLPVRLAVASKQVFGLGDRAAGTWNPLDDGNPASWRDILMAAEEWTEPHYRRAAGRYLGALLSALADARDLIELDEVVELLEQPKRATGLVRQVNGKSRDRLTRAIAAVEAEPSLRSGVLGLGNRLALLCDSPASAGTFGAGRGIHLAGVLHGDRVIFSLPAAEFPDEAPAIAACAIQSLGAAGQRLAAGDERLRAVLVVDEAPRLGGQQLREAVAIGRGAGIGTVIAVQDFADLDYVAAGTREAVETGANTWIVMRQVASAEDIADALGSRTTTKETAQHDRHRFFATDTGRRSVREVEAYRISPNVFRDMKRGEAVVWRRLRGRIERVLLEPPPGGGGRRDSGRLIGLDSGAGGVGKS
jgi:conjugal transfer pilus assembly protein TraD